MATILLVDDVELFLELERSFLAEMGHRIVTLKSGEAALEQLAEIAPDLLLLDLYMPGIDGDEVCRRLRRDPRWTQLPVIMVTAAGKDAEIRKCLAAGCDDYLTKPVNKKELLEKVERLLGKLRVRTEPRARIDLRVQLRSTGRCLSASARDISRNGVYIRSEALFNPGTVVEVTLELPDGRSQVMLGKVKRVEPGPEGGMGIYFIHPEPEGQAVLAGLIGQCPAPLPPAADTATGPAAEALARAREEQAGRELREENLRLQQRIRELEQENIEFANQMLRTEEINNNLTNLYIASSRLHSVLDRDQVVEIIREIIINFVGAEKFALLVRDRESPVLYYEIGEGFDKNGFPVVKLGEGVLGQVAADCRNYFVEEPVAGGSDDPLRPLVAIPLTIHGEALGVLAVYRLFSQKEQLQAVDFQLFAMLAEHAATAIFSSSLYAASERKQQTYRGLMDLLLK
ncbi:GAF domain-containing protein [Desulfuromonas sp. DDH964]|uniref:response regulator n=1 Tax=Desulfuromonas sp. DDH964 TaxID=1823759 RepID=UPI00078DD9B6|nr:response regulator [Desulfuromonas sp. DDH964]AMV71002.1 GAF domain-containing protein [Desulfuromonas sp. DDH964]